MFRGGIRLGDGLSRLAVGGGHLAAVLLRFLRRLRRTFATDSLIEGSTTEPRSLVPVVGCRFAFCSGVVSRTRSSIRLSEHSTRSCCDRAPRVHTLVSTVELLRFLRTDVVGGCPG